MHFILTRIPNICSPESWGILSDILVVTGGSSLPYHCQERKRKKERGCCEHLLLIFVPASFVWFTSRIKNIEMVT